MTGELVLSSNKTLVEKQIIPNKINAALIETLSEKKSGVKKNLTHADINYQNSYQYIKDKSQNPIANIRKQLNEMKDQLRHCKIEYNIFIGNISL